MSPICCYRVVAQQVLCMNSPGLNESVCCATAELMFNGCFHGLDKHQLLALVSCLTPTDKTNEQVALVKPLAEPLKQLQDAAIAIASISREAGLEVEEEDYVASFRPSLMDVFYNWSKGKSFAEVSSYQLLPFAYNQASLPNKLYMRACC